MDWLKNIVGKANRWIDTKIFGNKQETTPSVGQNPNEANTQTLNEQINTGTINQPSSGSQQFESGFNKTLNQQVQDGSINQNPTVVENEIDTQSSGFLSKDEKVTDLVGNELVNAQRAEDDKSWIQKVGERINGANKTIDKIVNGQRADSDYQANEKFVAVGYNPDNNDVYYLDLNDAGGRGDSTENLFNNYYAEFAEKIQRPGVTAAEQQQARMDFYDSTKNMFRIKGDDYYSDGFFFNNNGTGLGRRKDMYSQEQLDTLASNNVKKGDYIPSFDERLTYLEVKQDNLELKQEIYAGYGLAGDTDDDGTPTINLNADAQSKWLSGWNEAAMKGLPELLNSKIGSINGKARTDAEISITQMLNNRGNRLYQIAAPVYALEQVVLATPQSERTDGDLGILETAEAFRRMERAGAEGFNNWARQQILYGTDESGNIVDVLDTFENGESLNDVLFKGVREASGRDWRAEKHTSDIDMFSMMANEAIYNYNKGKHGAIVSAWNWLEHVGEPVGDWLGEGGQFVAGTLMDLTNAFFTGKGTTTSAYMDQDFTIGMLIETDDGNIKRTLKKYALQGLEYLPEGLGNLAPDIALIAATGGTGFGAMGAKWLTKMGKVSDAMKVAKGTTMLSRRREAKKAVDVAKGVEALKDLSTVAKNTKGISQTMKAGLQILDNALTQGIIGQMMDAQRSVYDTEPYSDASFWLSVIGTTVGDIGIELFKGRALQGLVGLASKNVIGNSIWDLTKYMDSSPEAAANIARAIGKNLPDISFEDLRTYLKNFKAVEHAAADVYNGLSKAGQVEANKWSKQILYNYVTQAFGSNSQIAKNIRLILSNGSTNMADIVKYLGRIPGEVSVGPFISTIKLKNGTNAAVSAIKGGTNGAPAYNTALDVATGGFDTKLKNGFTAADIDKISKIDGYSDVGKNRDNLFYKVGNKYHINEEGLSRFGLKAENLSLDSIGVSIAEAEEVKGMFKDKLKGLKSKKISDDTVDMLADSGGYEEVVYKVKEVLGC